MPQAFNIGDRVRCVDNDGFKRLEVGKEYTVSDASLRFVYLDGDKRESCNGWYPRHFELVKPEPKFSVGQRVRTKLSIWCYGLDEGTVGVVRALSDDPTSNFPYKVSFPEKGDGYVFLAESEIEPAPTQEFKLKPGDKVKNLKTGRVGKVYQTCSNGVKVMGVDGLRFPLSDVPASALEAWEAEHPGTYDLVAEGNPPW